MSINTFNFSVSQIFLVLQSLIPCGKFCLWTLMIAINMSVAICQLATCEFSAFGKKANVPVLI